MELLLSDSEGVVRGMMVLSGVSVEYCCTMAERLVGMVTGRGDGEPEGETEGGGERDCEREGVADCRGGEEAGGEEVA